MTWTPVAVTPETYTPQALNDDFLDPYLLTENDRVILTETHLALEPD